MKKRILFGVVILALVGILTVGPRMYDRYQRDKAISEVTTVQLPDAASKPNSSAMKQMVRKPSAKDTVNWDVPFTPQAPLANWDPPFDEACEEASSIMVLRYFADRPFTGPDDAAQDIARLAERAQKELGQKIDQTAQEVAALLALENERLRISVVANPTEEGMKQWLAEGSLIILPAAGRELGNPYFQTPGPLYHMLVVRGYTADGYAITNDPGTKNGKNYPYKWSVLLNANHDWNGGNVAEGDKVAIVIGQYVIE